MCKVGAKRAPPRKVNLNVRLKSNREAEDVGSKRKTPWHAASPLPQIKPLTKQVTYGAKFVIKIKRSNINLVMILVATGNLFRASEYRYQTVFDSVLKN